MEAIYHPEGRISYDNSRSFPWQWEYTLSDHLGNARVTFKADPLKVGINDKADENDIIQENSYYPFGMNMSMPFAYGAGNPLCLGNQYLYNGKEMQCDFDLDWLDYGARFYDGAVGRWWSVDPMTDIYYAWSGYHYGINNPIKMIDPNGMFSSAAMPGMIRNESINEMDKLWKEMIEVKKEQNQIMQKINDFLNDETQPSVSLTITNSEVSTVNVVDNYYETDNHLYYVVPTYGLDVDVNNNDGTSSFYSYEVIRYGVKRSSHGSPPYYQGFGANNYSESDETYSLESFFTSDSYSKGAFKITGPYLLHSGPRQPREIPPYDNGSGRRNYGCIAVCGIGQWEHLLTVLKGATNSTTNRGIQVNLISVTVQPLRPPTETPVGQPVPRQ